MLLVKLVFVAFLLNFILRYRLMVNKEEEKEKEEEEEVNQ